MCVRGKYILELFFFILLTILSILSIISFLTFSTLLIVKATSKKGPSIKLSSILSGSSAFLLIASVITILIIAANSPSPERGKQETAAVNAEEEKKAEQELNKKEKQEKIAKDKEEEKTAGEEKAEEERLKKETEDMKQTSENDDKHNEKINKKEQSPPSKKDESVIGKSQKTVYEIFKFGNDSLDETITNIEFDDNEKALSVTVKGKDGWSDKSIGEGFYEDSTTAYHELSKDKRINEVWITITFPMQDKYGNVSDEEVMGTWMSRETMDKINWKSFNYENLLDVVDGKRIYPQFVQ